MTYWTDTTWRNSALHVKFFKIDARLLVFFIVLIAIPSLWLLYLTIAACVFFYGLEYYGYTMPNAIRKIKVTISGNTKAGVHWWRRSKFK